MSGKNIAMPALAFLIFISLICQTASATIYTFNHAKCSTEDPTVCICDTYSGGTDTCTIDSLHNFSQIGNNDIKLSLNFNNIDIESSGILIANTVYGIASISIDSKDVDIYGMIDAVTGFKSVSTVGTTSKLTIKADTMLRIHGGGNIGGSTGNGYAMALTIDTGTLIVSGIINNTRDNTFSSGSDDYSLSGATTIKAGSISLGGGLIKSGNQITQTIKYCTLTPEVCEDAVGCPNIIAEPGKLFLIRYCEFPPPTCFGGDGCTQPCSPVDPDCPPPPTPTSAPTLLSLDGTVTDTDNQPINGTVTVESLKKCRNSGCSSFSGFVSLAGATNDVFIIDGIVNGMIGPYNTFTDITYLLTVKVCNDLSTPICDQIQIRFTD